MARLRRDKQGYVTKSITFEGRHYKIRAKSESELYQKIADKMEELQEGYDKIHNPSLFQYYEHIVTVRRKQRQESTIRQNLVLMNKLFNHKQEDNSLFGNMKVKDVKRYDIERARLEMLEEGIKPEYLNNIFAHFNTVLNEAVKEDVIQKNPCIMLGKLKRQAPPVSETKHRALTKAETKAFMEVAKERNSFYINAFAFMLLTGVRFGEMTALTHADIDVKQGVIHIRKTIQRVESGVYKIVDTTKTVSGKRDIPLTDNVLAIIKNQDKLNEMMFGNVINMSNEKSQLIFRSSENNILRDYTFNREIARICKQAEIEVFTSHGFRNTFATRYIEEHPHDYKIVSEILGHKDIGITLNIYTHVMEDEKKKSMNSLDFTSWGIG